MDKNNAYRVGDRVFFHANGWGKVMYVFSEDDTTFPVQVNFENGTAETFTLDGRYDTDHPNPELSYTEYDFVHGGFSQVRPRPILKHGTIIYVRSGTQGDWHMRPFYGWMDNGNVQVYHSQKGSGFVEERSIWSLTNPLEGVKNE